MDNADSNRISQDLCEILTGILGLDEGTTIDVNKPLESIGLDSLLTVDLLATLEKKYGVKLEETAVADHPTVRGLASHVASKARA